MRDIFDEPSRIIRSVIGKASGGTSRALVVTQIEGMSLIKLPRAWYPAPDCPPSLRWAYPAGWADPSTSPTTGGSTSIRATSTGFEWYDDQGGSGSISASLYTGSDRDIASAARSVPRKTKSNRFESGSPYSKRTPNRHTRSAPSATTGSTPGSDASGRDAQTPAETS